MKKILLAIIFVLFSADQLNAQSRRGYRRYQRYRYGGTQYIDKYRSLRYAYSLQRLRDQEAQRKLGVPYRQNWVKGHSEQLRKRDNAVWCEYTPGGPAKERSWRKAKKVYLDLYEDCYHHENCIHTKKGMILMKYNDVVKIYPHRTECRCEVADSGNVANKEDIIPRLKLKKKQ